MTEEIKLQIQVFLNSDEEFTLIPLVQLSKLAEYFEELGYEQTDWDTNGWQVDWWLSMVKNNDKIFISGGLWDSDEITISKK